MFQRCIPHHLGRLRARGYRPLYGIQWQDMIQWMRDCSVMVRFIIPSRKTIDTCDNGIRARPGPPGRNALSWFGVFGVKNPSNSTKTLEIEPRHCLSSYDAFTQASRGTSSLNDGGVVNTGLENTAFEFERGAGCFQNYHDCPKVRSAQRTPLPIYVPESPEKERRTRSNTWSLAPGDARKTPW